MRRRESDFDVLARVLAASSGRWSATDLPDSYVYATPDGVLLLRTDGVPRIEIRGVDGNLAALCVIGPFATGGIVRNGPVVGEHRLFAGEHVMPPSSFGEQQ